MRPVHPQLGTQVMTAPEFPTYDTYEKAAAAQRARQREPGGVFSGIVRVGDVWALRCDVTWSGR